MAEENMAAAPSGGATSTFRRVLAWLLRWSPWLLVLWPAVTLHVLIRQFAINAPFLDDYMSVPLFDKAARGTLTVHDLFAVQMEHRIVWERVVQLVAHRLWPGHCWIAQIWFSWVLACLTLVNVGILLKRTTGRPLRRCWPLLALASLVIFSPVQFEIFL